VRARRQDPRVCAAGAREGPVTFYFHGAPGAPCELRAFDAPSRACGLTLQCIDRFALDAALTGSAYFDALAEAVRAAAGARQVNVIGFSIGACLALHTSRLLGSQVAHIHLVSAAAPLQSGDFLPRMAGRAVFRAALASPALFRAMTLGQAALARLAPDLLRSLLFRSAVGADRALAADPSFRRAMNHLLHVCLSGGRAGYVRDILAYVQDWSATPPQVAAATTLWHGSLDNWSPPEMANSLQRGLPACRQLNLMQGLSHYSCLQAAAPQICRLLAGASA
jgi:pimeloyl-ACP methyl ester carboxylesterase